MIYKVFISFFLAALFLQCTSHNTQSKDADSKDSVSTGQKNASIIILKEGENQFVKDLQMNLKFNKVSEDSRCPQDVNCIWAGIGLVDIELMTTASRPMLFQLATYSYKEKNYKNEVEFNGYRIKLLKLTPHPSKTNPSSSLKGKYSITLQATNL